MMWLYSSTVERISLLQRLSFAAQSFVPSLAWQLSVSLVSLVFTQALAVYCSSWVIDIECVKRRAPLPTFMVRTTSPFVRYKEDSLYSDRKMWSVALDLEGLMFVVKDSLIPNQSGHREERVDLRHVSGM